MKRVLHWLDAYLEESLMIAGLAAMALIMGIQVISRYVFGASLSWSEEITRYIFIWCGFLSVSYCTKKCVSIKIEQFVARLSRHAKACVKVFNHTVELAFFLYMIPFAWSYMMSAVHNGQLSPACRIPMYYIQAAPFVSFVLCAFRIVQRWIIEFRIMLGQKVSNPAHPERNTPESFVEAGTPSSKAGRQERKENQQISRRQKRMEKRAARREKEFFSLYAPKAARGKKEDVPC